MGEEKLVSTSHAEICWSSLVIAMLSVNNYPLDRTLSHFEELELQGLFNPENLAIWNLDETVQRLTRGGYDRGPVLTAILAERLVALGRYAKEVGRERFEKTLADGEPNEISEMLMPVRGIGPVVLGNYKLLQQAERAASPSTPAIP